MFNIILERNPFTLSESPKSVKLTLNGNTNSYANGHTNGSAKKVYKF
jgi:hypothetical protein